MGRRRLGGPHPQTTVFRTSMAPLAPASRQTGLKRNETKGSEAILLNNHNDNHNKTITKKHTPTPEAAAAASSRLHREDGDDDE